MPQDEAKFPLMGSAPPPKRPRKPSTMPLLALSGFLAMGLMLVLLSFGHCVLTRGTVCYKGYESPFSFDIDLAHNPRWMTPLPDDAHITSLSIPGTHDTMTYDMVRNTRLQCQNHNLTNQLEAGLRYFDIRGRLVNDTIGIYHANAYTGYTLTDVVRAMFGFLDENPGEAIIMRLKEEGRPVGPVARKLNRTFEEVFKHFRLDNPDTAPGFARHLFSVPAGSPQSAFLPTLGALRGKVLLLEEFPVRGEPYGLLWDGDLMQLEDLWQIPTPDHLEDKWAAIEDNLDLTRLSPDDNSALYVSHLSASFGVLPIVAAAGTLDHEVTGMNDRTGQWLAREDTGGRTGVVIIDFPGKDLVDAIIERNAGLGAET